MLEVENLAAGYGDVGVLADVALTVGEREVVALVGPNGAGKTTLCLTLLGQVQMSNDSSIRFNGEEIGGLGTPARVARGLAIVPEGRRLFQGMSVEENLTVGGYTHWSANGRDERERIFALFPRLGERRRQLAGTLSGGEQQMCAIGRALMARPRLLVIDELSLGLAPRVASALVESLKQIQLEVAMAILLVEQNVLLAADLARRAYVMAGGEIVYSCQADRLYSEPEQLQRAFLGVA